MHPHHALIGLTIDCPEQPQPSGPTPATSCPSPLLSPFLLLLRRTCLLVPLPQGEGGLKDDAAAEAFYRAAARGGNAQALFALGRRTHARAGAAAQAAAAVARKARKAQASAAAAPAGSAAAASRAASLQAAAAEDAEVSSAADPALTEIVREQLHQIAAESAAAARTLGSSSSLGSSIGGGASAAAAARHSSLAAAEEAAAALDLLAARSQPLTLARQAELLYRAAGLRGHVQSMINLGCEAPC